MVSEIYSIKELLLIPTLAKTDAGFYLAIEPVEVLRGAGVEELALALARVEERGNPRVPTPPRNAFPKPVVLKHAGVRSQAEFDRRARAWGLEWSNEGIVLIPTYRAPEGGFLDVPNEKYVATGEHAREGIAREILRSLASPI